MSTAAFFLELKDLVLGCQQDFNELLLHMNSTTAIILFSQLICFMFVFVSLLKWLSRIALSLQFISCFYVEDSVIYLC